MHVNVVARWGRPDTHRESAACHVREARHTPPSLMADQGCAVNLRTQLQASRDPVGGSIVLNFCLSPLFNFAADLPSGARYCWELGTFAQAVPRHKALRPCLAARPAPAHPPDQRTSAP